MQKDDGFPDGFIPTNKQDISISIPNLNSDNMLIDTDEDVCFVVFLYFYFNINNLIFQNSWMS